MLLALVQWLVRRTETRFNRILFTLGIGVLAGGFEAVLDYWLRIHAGVEWRLAFDAVSVGLLVALITYVEIAAVQVRRKRMEMELHSIAELNHNVRNALQAISYAIRLPETEGHVEIIDDCVHRIDMTLRELFPANVPDPRAPLRRQSSPSSTHR